ncbi:tail protein X [Luteibacter mycovicinus]|uniref:tail protein X n=1 Tax=Luteibacter mycovicinus TaxID=1500890 RepID=UPI00055B26F0|nr:tail protein X [Luteibacter sp. 9143a]
MTAEADVVRARQGDTVDAICWRELGATRGVTEQVLELNRGLARLGPILPEGTLVKLPARATVAPAVLPLINLWD